jgi:nitrogen fixation-related uncharacterized protein
MLIAGCLCPGFLYLGGIRAVRSGQYEDGKSLSVRILFEEEKPANCLGK